MSAIRPTSVLSCCAAFRAALLEIQGYPKYTCVKLTECAAQSYRQEGDRICEDRNQLRKERDLLAHENEQLRGNLAQVILLRWYLRQKK
jgi:hypothetical protein